MSPFSIPDAKNLLTAAINQKGGTFNPGNSGDQNAILLRLMSSLYNKIKKLDSGIEKGNTAIIHVLAKTRPTAQQSILHPPTFTTTPATDDLAVSLVARRHKKAVRQRGEAPDMEEVEYEDERENEEIIDEEEEDEKGYSDNNDWGVNA